MKLIFCLENDGHMHGTQCHTCRGDSNMAFSILSDSILQMHTRSRGHYIGLLSAYILEKAGDIGHLLK